MPLTLKALPVLGWRTLVIWECEITDTKALGRKLCSFFGPSQKVLCCQLCCHFGCRRRAERFQPGGAGY